MGRGVNHGIVVFEDTKTDGVAIFINEALLDFLDRGMGTIAETGSGLLK